MPVRIGRRVCAALLICAACSFGVAQAASAASLKISVPTSTHPRQSFKITTTGSYVQSQITGIAFLVAFMQPDAKPCLPTGKGEFNQRGLDAYFANQEPSSPFRQVHSSKAGTKLGAFRVCAYLYPQTVAPQDNVAPIAKASALYHIVKK